MKKIKTVLCMVLCMTMLMSVVGVAGATSASAGAYVPTWRDLGLSKEQAVELSRQDIYLNGKKLVWDENVYGQCFIISNRVYLPMRIVSEMLGAGDTVKWDQKTLTASVMTPNGKMTMKNLDKYVTLGDEKKESADSFAVLMFNGRTYTALRLFIETGWGSDIKVSWRPGVVSLDGTVKPPMADTGSDGNTSVDSVLTEYDPASLEQTNAIGPKLAESFGKSALGFPVAEYIVDQFGNNNFLSNPSDGRGLTLKMHVESDGTIVITDSDFSNTKQGQAFMSMVDAFLGDTTNPRIKTPVMAMFNKLVTKLSIGVNNAGGYSDDNVKWCDENLHDKAFSLTDDYAIMFTGQGSMYSINIFEKSTGAADLTISNFRVSFEVNR